MLKQSDWEKIPVIRIEIKPKNPEHTAELGTATVTLDVTSPDERGKPQVEASLDLMGAALKFLLHTNAHNEVGFIVPADQHDGFTMLHNINAFDIAKAYTIEVVEGEDLIVVPKMDLPPGAIP